MSSGGARTATSPLGRPLIDETFFDDPYPTYAALREAGAIHWSDEFFGGAWLLTRHADVEAALRDPRLSARRTGGWVMDASDGGHEELKPFQRLFARAMLFLDEPDHGRLRRVLQVGFRAGALQRLTPHIEALIDEIFKEIDPRQGFDFIERIATPLPARVIARLLDVDGEEDLGRFLAWSEDLAAFIGAPRPAPEQARRAQIALLSMSRCFERRMSRGRPREDSLLDCLVQGTEGVELVAQCAMLLFAGYETTRNLLGNGMYHLLAEPSRWRQLRCEPQRLPMAIRELLRFDSPVQYTGRRVAQSVVLHGQRLRRGDLVVALIGAANRDPRRHADPDRVDLARSSPGSLSFGSGPHACIGAALTLIEAEVVFRRSLQRFPKFGLTVAAPRWNRRPLYRGLAELRIAPQ